MINYAMLWIWLWSHGIVSNNLSSIFLVSFLISVTFRFATNGMISLLSTNNCSISFCAFSLEYFRIDIKVSMRLLMWFELNLSVMFNFFSSWIRSYSIVYAWKRCFFKVNKLSYIEYSWSNNDNHLIYYLSVYSFVKNFIWMRRIICIGRFFSQMNCVRPQKH